MIPFKVGQNGIQDYIECEALSGTSLNNININYYFNWLWVECRE